MKEIAIKVYWILTIISQVLLLIVIFNNIPYEDISDMLMIVFGGVLIPFSWLTILQVDRLMKTNDEIDDAFNKAENEINKWAKALKVLEEIALEKMGVTVDEISKRMNKDK